MAASMFRIQLGRCSQGVIHGQCKRNASASASYYVLLPEVPPDVPESNAIMRTHEYTQFNSINPDNVITGCAKYAIMYDVELGKHVQNLKDPNFPKNFNSVFVPLEKILVPMNHAWRTAKQLNYTKSEGYRKAFQRVHQQIERARNERWISVPLYNAVKEVNADYKNLNEYQQRIVNMYLLEARLNGIDFDGFDRKKFLENLANLTKAKNHYRNRVMLSHNLFSQFVDDFGAISEMPKQLAYQMAVDQQNPSRGPWKVTLNNDVYQPFMEYCSNRMQRWGVWHAYNNRSSVGQDEQNLSNHNIIKDIRLHRKDIANMLGYENFAEMSMQTKMAGSVENVLNMIECFKSNLRETSNEEVLELEEFAASEGFTHGNIQMWDLPYWRRRHKERVFPLNSQEVSQYFPFKNVLEKLHKFTSELFGITFKDCTHEVDTWHEDVRFYKIYNKTEPNCEIAAYYLDPYLRPGKLVGSWVDCAREKSSVVGSSPVAYMNLSLLAPYVGQPTLLSHQNLVDLFTQFGNTLQQTLTQIEYSEIAGQKNIEWDALQICGQVMNMLMNTPKRLQQLSSHRETGENIPDNLVNLMLKAQGHMKTYDLMYQLYLSAYDMEVYVSDDHWYQIMKRIWYEFMCVPLDNNDNHPCSLTSIYSDQYAAAYYSIKWSEMIAADIVEAFHEAESEGPEKMALVGKRFRDTFLASGGGIPMSEIFRRFRGRDPSQDALLKLYML